MRRRGIPGKSIFAEVAAPVVNKSLPDACHENPTPNRLRPARGRCIRGAEAQAIGITKGGRNSKIYAVVDEFCRPWVFVLTPGNTADCVMAEDCVSLIPGVAKLIADKGYDTDAFRSYLKEQGIKPVILGKSNRKTRVRYDKLAYKGRNVVERCFCRLKDFPASPRVMTSSPETSSRRFTSSLLWPIGFDLIESGP